MKATRPIHLLNLIALLVLFGFAASVFDDLPRRVPIHFNFSGSPDRWVELSWLNWLLLPLTALGLALFNYACTLLIPYLRKRPDLINVPNKEKFLRMTPVQREPLFQAFGDLFYWMTLPMTLFFLALQRESYLVATGDAKTISVWAPMIILFTVVLGLIIYFVAKVNRIIGVAKTGR